MLLEKKNAVIYGAGGALGGAIAKAFAREGAKVFLAGRTRASLDAVAEEIAATGGAVETAVVDATDEQGVEEHADMVVKKAGSIDVSICSIRIADPNVRNAQGSSLIELSPENFAFPITVYTRTHFLTARAAARRMIEKRSGVILTLTPTPARMAIPSFGGLVPAWAAMEALTRSFAAELGPQGIRVIGLRSDAIPETETIQENYNRRAKLTGRTLEEILAQAESVPLLRRLPTLAEVANVAAFLASDQASAMTATVANLSCGSLVD
jgi:NAD(P)-dependent dehydrogenase (short-subunit alcohol dehydrogenase family)